MASEVTAGPAATPAGAPPGCFGCLSILGIPFLLAGLAGAWVAVSRASQGGSAQAKAPALFALFFGVLGIQLVVTGMWARGVTKRLRMRQAAAPGQPWL
jgi:hypothetical protein